MLRRGPVLALMVTLAAALLGACSGSSDTAQPPASTTPTVPATAPSTTTTPTVPTVPPDADLAVTRDPFQPQG